MNICVNTQTPLVRFRISAPDLIEKYGILPEVIDLSTLSEGEDFSYSPGGVTAMVYPLLKKMKGSGIVDRAMWVSLSPESPTEITTGDITFVNIDLGRHDAERYVRFKDKLWNEIHGTERMSFVADEYLSFNLYSWKTADVLLQNLANFDLFYIHDFQQLQIGNFVGPFAPAVYRWHIPANLDNVSGNVRKFIVRNMEAYDAMIVSTRKDLEALFRSGYRGEAYQIYPHIDESDWHAPDAHDIEEFLARTGLKNGERFFLTVARMDPMKGQDVAIRAMKHLQSSFPDMKLLLVGNGSFSGSSTGGLSSSKSSNWKKKLSQIISENGLEGKVLMIGHLEDRLVRAAYHLCECLILSSGAEGFGLVTVEAWRMRRPVIVSTGCGSSELVVEGINGFTFPPGDDGALAERMKKLLKGDKAGEMGSMGYEASKQCYVDSAVKKLVPIFEKVISRY
ncbi:MAG: glycosyltransferase family 4 protein [Thermoplasmata archaeon]|nr:glycosyltransferase family 4 protein [Candidatus Sysuiplasma acidicola]MBX8645984.1 glycosyltransferase family 4 protein [Candidatus Sysuiplasma acidicola]